MKHTIEDQLVTLDIIDKKKVAQFFPQVRDRKDVSVLKCAKSGVIYLSSTHHIEQSYYNDKKGASYWSASNREDGLKTTAEDDTRRFHQFKDLVKGKTYLDVGSGLGGVLDQFKTVAKEVSAIEPQDEIRDVLNSIGYKVYNSIESAPPKNVEVISLFHVFEHLTDPLGSLQNLHKLLTDNGKIIIEIPHGRDALIETYNLDSFKAFTFWSEHLILHTRQSLETFLKASGYKNIKVSGYQRYPLANHLYWLNKGQPGGQNHYSHLRNPKLEEEYAKQLDNIDQTDTLIAIAEK